MGFEKEGISEEEYQKLANKTKNKFFCRYGRYPTEEEFISCSEDGILEDDLY